MGLTDEEVLKLKNIRMSSVSLWVYVIFTFVFLFDILLGDRPSYFLGMFFVVLWIPWIVSKVLLIKQDYDSPWYSSVILISYLIFYSGAVFSSQDSVTWMYMLPITYISFTMFNTVVATTLTGTLVGLTVADLIIERATYGIRHNFFDIRHKIFVLVLCVVFVLYVSKIVNIYENRLKKILHTINFDELTGFFNHEVAERNTDKFISSNGYFSVTSAVLIDIDGFSSISKKYSKTHRDKVISLVADIVRRAVAESGIDCDTYYYPVDKFLIIAKDKERDDMRSFAETICKNVNNMILNFKQDAETPLTVSIGITDTGACSSLCFMELYDEVIRTAEKAKDKGGGMIYISKKGLR